MQGLEDADVRELAIHRWLSRVEMRRSIGCEGISEDGFSLAPGMEIGYVIKDAAKWEVDAERYAARF